MGKTKINKDSWARTPKVYYVGAMRGTDGRIAEVETENVQWVTLRRSSTPSSVRWTMRTRSR